ncbi:23S rRNA (uracil(1939)-C(5))-methyltransferase RlmD [Putridiphycobacter roseus]|uniref:23S rRNA (Uracil(1939)-C(5))-methyltransferase RlmD n=1 Tax=Putridiphycobacter roseus TaxID=2219161 RepID=A0A2W1MY19_9FLAO|nr:23S rRNA (uracil(1939)-C(5))-methyltransferase RlmD [Putridiphycobacter roseus]PZE16274.1 23S rRNA (uracil(1939)-C(5))-methyltransferase RlmD [Putridiphycobacter roseus]
MKRGEIIEVDITGYAFGGKGFSKIENENGPYIIFVDNTIPGQKVSARIAKKRKKHAECKLIEVLTPSSDEKQLPYQPISGAPYISLPIEKQQAYKKESTIDIYRKLGGFQNNTTLFDEFIESPEIFDYRNKMEYSFSTIRKDLETGEELDDQFALGFKTRGTWWKVENLNKPDGLFDAAFEEKLKEVRLYLEKTELPAWHPPQKKGFFRHLVVRKSFKSNQLLINLVSSSQGLKLFDRASFKEFMVNLFGDRLAGLQHTINDDVADRAKIENGNNQLLYGTPTILEELKGLMFEISMESFFQTNPKSAERLYTKAIDYAQEKFELKDEIIMDLFCGTGTIGQIVANELPNIKVIGVDIVAEAIEDAKRNAKRNAVENIEFYAADVGKFLKQYPDYNNKIHTIFLDPPRAGIAPKTLKMVIELNAKQIVYISCNPATQARDARELEDHGYVFQKFSLVDQFPHTSHIEAVGLFIKE